MWLALALAPACRCGAEPDAAPIEAPAPAAAAEGTGDAHAVASPLREALDALCTSATEVASDPAARTTADRAAATWSALQGTEAWDVLVPFLRDVPDGPPQTLPDRIRAQADAAGVGPFACPALDDVLGARAAVAAPPLPADADAALASLCALAARAGSDTSIAPEHRVAWWEERARADVEHPDVPALVSRLAATEPDAGWAVLEAWAAEHDATLTCASLRELLAP